MSVVYNDRSDAISFYSSACLLRWVEDAEADLMYWLNYAKEHTLEDTAAELEEGIEHYTDELFRKNMIPDDISRLYKCSLQLIDYQAVAKLLRDDPRLSV